MSQSRISNSGVGSLLQGVIAKATLALAVGTVLGFVWIAKRLVRVARIVIGELTAIIQNETCSRTRRAAMFDPKHPAKCDQHPSPWK